MAVSGHTKLGTIARPLAGESVVGIGNAADHGVLRWFEAD
jgi:hypothetical protein